LEITLNTARRVLYLWPGPSVRLRRAVCAGIFLRFPERPELSAPESSSGSLSARPRRRRAAAAGGAAAAARRGLWLS